MTALALALGVASSFACIGFREAVAAVQLLSWGVATERLASHVAGLPWWTILAVPTAGGIAVGLLRRYVAADRRLHGIADVVEAAALARRAHGACATAWSPRPAPPSPWGRAARPDARGR